MFKESISKFFKLDNLISNITGYVETRLELLKMEVKEDVSEALSKAIVYLLIGFVLALVVLFASTCAALFIGNRIDNIAGGFGIVAGFYLLIGLGLYLSRGILNKKLERKLNSSLFRKRNT